jgi:transposase
MFMYLRVDHWVPAVCRSLAAATEFPPAVAAARAGRPGRHVAGISGLEQTVGHFLRVRREVVQRLDDLHRLVLAAVKDDPVCRLLMSVTGVGPVTALAYRTAVENPARFAGSRDVGAHFGLTPRRYASGERPTARAASPSAATGWCGRCCPKRRTPC